MFFIVGLLAGCGMTRHDIIIFIFFALFTLCGALVARLIFDKSQTESLKSGYQTPMFVDFGDDTDSSTEYCNSVKTSSSDWEHIITNLALRLRPSYHSYL